MQNVKPRLIAFYLPQYHPIPENDAWWGKGFTEWTNVAKARPLFKGHYQPHLPADLGFYDLRLPETRQAQADMAREYGIHGFCYYHYWFNGKRLLERPFQEVLDSGKPDFPFMLCWANESWTGKWHGLDDKILIQQDYQGVEEFTKHFYCLLPVFKDHRYITVQNKPLFIVYLPKQLPDPKKFISIWNRLAIENGLNGVHFLGVDRYGKWNYMNDGFDGAIINDLGVGTRELRRNMQDIFSALFKRITNLDHNTLFRKWVKKPEIYRYQDFVSACLNTVKFSSNVYPSIIPNWDNTPRSNLRGIVLTNSTPELFKNYLLETIKKIRYQDVIPQIIFIKSWNEWAEGNYLEPDIKFGKAYLEIIKEVMIGLNEE